MINEKILKVKVQQAIRLFNNGWDIESISKDVNESTEWVTQAIVDLVAPTSVGIVDNVKKYKTKAGYVVIYRKGKYYMEHRLVWEKKNGSIPEGMVIVHLNGVKDDNRIENLAMVPRYSRRRSTDYACERRIRELESEIDKLKLRIKELEAK